MEPGRRHDLLYGRRRNGGVEKSRGAAATWADVPRASPRWVCDLEGGRGPAGSQGYRAALCVSRDGHRGLRLRRTDHAPESIPGQTSVAAARTAWIKLTTFRRKNHFSEKTGGGLVAR